MKNHSAMVPNSTNEKPLRSILLRRSPLNVECTERLRFHATINLSILCFFCLGRSGRLRFVVPGTRLQIVGTNVGNDLVFDCSFRASGLPACLLTP